MTWLDRIGAESRALRFLLRFAAYLAVLAVAFELGHGPWAQGYMRPLASIAAGALRALSLPAYLDTSDLQLGSCELILRDLAYRVTFDCTGVFALLVFAALTGAYPATARQRLEALLTGLPAIALFSCLRLVVLGAVAYVEPEWIEIFHVYVMELATLGFMLFVWKYWVNRVTHAG